LRYYYYYYYYYYFFFFLFLSLLDSPLAAISDLVRETARKALH
jgi:hypothetical protein